MQLSKLFAAMSYGVVLTGCVHSEPVFDPNKDSGLMWVKHSAEYRAATSQVYAQASRDLTTFVADTSWSVMPGQSVNPDLPPAIILDIDETIVSNVDFQMSYERPYSNHKRDAWSKTHTSLAVPGVLNFIQSAKTAGVEVFFVTGRPCEPVDVSDDPCPQLQTTLDDLAEIGIRPNVDRVMLSNQKPGWDREKLIRRRLIAESYRVIMLIGDDLSDFVPCARTKVMASCDLSATALSRQEAVEEYRKYWGFGWYILPNPMHGSWTSVL